MTLSSLSTWAISHSPTPDARHAARRLLMDQIGISIAGHDRLGRHPTEVLAARMTGRPGATLWSTGRMAHAPYAALANRCAGDELELTAGPECVAAAVAAAETADATMRDLLDAICVAAQVEEYLRGWLLLPMERHGLHPPAALAAVASASAVARLLQMPVDRCAGTLAAAVALAPQSAYVAFSRGASGKTIYGGWGQMLGLWSAMLSQAGTTGAATALEGNRGVAQALLDAGGPVTPPPFDPDGLAVARVPFKAYPCNRASHAALTAIDSLPTLPADDIAGVSILTYPYAVDLDRRSHGDAPIAAQVSIRTTVALRLLHGRLEPGRAFAPERLADPRVGSLVEAITVDTLPGMDDDAARVRLARVEVRMRDGRHHAAETEARWGAQAPASDAELRSRFEHHTAHHRPFDPWTADDSSSVRSLLARKTS